ncbi:MAG: hypothetical protein ACTHJL_05805 [Amnibacterium sp.]
MASDEHSAPAEYTASEETTIRHQQDWGRALGVVFERFGQQAEADGADPDTALIGAEVVLRIGETPDGVRIDATWRTGR